ncbi:MAG: AAA family ATPase [Polyangiales bacterium]
MIYAFDDFELDDQRLELRHRGAVVKVDRIVLRVLAVLLRSAGRLVTKDQLVEEVWEKRVVADNVLTVSVARLRRALQDRRGPREFVVTVYGLGYRFVRPVVARNTSIMPDAPPAIVSDAVPPMVGRAGPLADLRRGVADAHLGRGRMYTLIGEAGIGKTRLVSALTDELVGTPSNVAWGFCRESGSTPPLYPWLQLLRKLFATAPDEVWDKTLGSAAAELRELLDYRDTLPPPTSPTTPGPTLRAPRLRDIGVVARAFLQAAETSPWILVLEDLHRADATSLEVMSLLADEIGRSRILVIATVRDSASGRAVRPSTPLPAILGHTNAERIILKRLNRPDVLSYVATTLDDPDGRFGRAVFAKSDGNPFIMTELVRQIRRVESSDPDNLPLPEVALDVVRQRIAELDADTRSLLTSAAVVGARFELPLLQAVTGLEATVIARSFDDAIAADLLVPTPDSPSAFSFSHDLIRTVLYEEIPPAERRRRHHETALAMERRVKSTHVQPAPGELADHFYAALPDTDLEKTVRYCDAAAHTAGASFANTDVARYLRHALAALAFMPTPPLALRKALLLRLAVYTRGSAPEVFESSIREVVRLARESDDAHTQVRAAIMYNVHPEFSALSGGREALEHALASIDVAKAPGLRAAALAALATATPRAYTASARTAYLDEAEQLARGTPTKESLQIVLACRLFSEGGEDDDANAKIVDELGQLARAHPHRSPVLPLFISIHDSVRRLQRGDAAGASAAIERGKARSREVRHPELLWYFERFEALTKINQGAGEQGRAMLLKLHRHVVRVPILGSATFAAFDRAVVFPAFGASIRVDDELRLSLAYQEADTPAIWALKVRALSAAGLLDEARSVLAAVPAHKLAELPHDSQYLGTLGHLTRAVVALSAVEYVDILDRLLAPHDALFSVHASYFCEGAVPQLRGMLARMRGRIPEATALLRRGLVMSEQAGFVLCAYDACVELSECLLDLDRARNLDTAQQLASQASQLSARYGLLGNPKTSRLMTSALEAEARIG